MSWVLSSTYQGITMMASGWENLLTIYLALLRGYDVLLQIGRQAYQ